MSTVLTAAKRLTRPGADDARLHDAKRVFWWGGYGVGALNTFAGLVVGVWIDIVLPIPLRPDGAHQIIVNSIAFGLFVGVAFVIAPVVSYRLYLPIERWLLADRPPTDPERRSVLRHPFRQSLVHAGVWLGALPVFVPLNVGYSGRLALDIGMGIVLAGITMTTISYLLMERLERPVLARVLASGPPPRQDLPGVATRLVLAWALGTGVPLLGIAFTVFDHRAGDPSLTAPLVALVVIGVVSGLLVMRLSAASVADPIESVTEALARIERGHYDVEVPVYDASEVGRLQRGVNAMAAGLRERQRLVDLFGRQVGTDVAEHALEHGVQLGGQEIHAAVLFVDVIGSTSLTTTRSPSEVVSCLNEFFNVVVDVVDSCDGLVNKFEGDAALCVFGAPVPHGNPCTSALRAARKLQERLNTLSGLDAGIGVSGGQVIAGNIGSATRFEYTVIGDPVNEAARLTELAKDRPERVLAAAEVVRGADPDEAARWQVIEEVVVRGRTTPTQLAVPRPPPTSPMRFEANAPR